MATQGKYAFIFSATGNLFEGSIYWHIVDAVNECTVTYNSNGGGVAAQTVREGELFTEPTAPVKDGYTFAGWYADAALTTKYDFASPVTKSMELYAKWEAIVVPAEKATVTFESNGGSKIASVTVEKGSVVSSPAAPVKDGYILAGWYTDAGFTTLWDFAKNIVDTDITLYAKWEKSAVVDPASAPTPEVKPSTTVPQTNDSSNIALWVTLAVDSVLSVAGIGFVLAYKKKKENM